MTAIAVVAVAVALSRAGTPVLPTTAQPVAAAGQSPVAPELTGITAFDNTAPLTLASLRGRVVLVDFWTYTCINCRRTFPFLRALASTYQRAGLTVLGVHSPEFGFEKEHANVARAVRELGVTWPVAEDPEMATWQAFHNQYWPADYLVDRHGKIRYGHFGEGAESELEQAVRDLLGEDGSDPGPRVGEVRTSESPGDEASDLTPETYFGEERGGAFLAGGRVVPAGTTLTRTDGPQDRDVVGLRGRFTGGAEYLELEAGAAVTQRFHARDVYLTCAPAGAPVVLDVTLGGKPVPPQWRGSSLQVRDGRTVAVVTAQDLLHLLSGPALADGTLVLTARSPGARFFTFTYGA